nr:MAG TPA: hypothetical protein [Caudoviricetes sp.]
MLHASWLFHSQITSMSHLPVLYILVKICAFAVIRN